MHSCTSYPQHGEFSLAQNLRVIVVRAAQRIKKQSSDLPLVAGKPQNGLFSSTSSSFQSGWRSAGQAAHRYTCSCKCRHEGLVFPLRVSLPFPPGRTDLSSVLSARSYLGQHRDLPSNATISVASFPLPGRERTIFISPLIYPSAVLQIHGTESR